MIIMVLTKQKYRESFVRSGKMVVFNVSFNDIENVNTKNARWYCFAL